MAAYYFARNGEKNGPFTAAEFKTLTATGKLLPSDLVWKEGMPQWVVASAVKGLLPVEQPLGTQTQANALSASTVIAEDTETPAFEKAAAAAKRHALTAGRIASLTAERAKIASVSLPLAHARLGQYCYEHRLHETTFPQIFQELDNLEARMEAAKMEMPLASTATFVEKAKGIADKALQVANAQRLAAQQKASFVRLGKEAYEQAGVGAGPESTVHAVAELVARLTAVDQALKESVVTAGGAKTLLAIAGGVVLVSVVVGAILFRETDGTSSPVDDETQQTTAADNPAHERDRSMPGSHTVEAVPLEKPRAPQQKPPPKDAFQVEYASGVEEGRATATALIQQYKNNPSAVARILGQTLQNAENRLASMDKAMQSSARATGKPAEHVVIAYMRALGTRDGFVEAAGPAME